MPSFLNLAMTLAFILVFSGLIAKSFESIAGVTYMDHFDFEQRYRDVTECDPFYWHPLHLPEHCTEMFEDLIRSRLASNQPFRIMREKENEVIYHMYPSNGASDGYYNTDIISSSARGEPSVMSPYLRMLDLLRHDVMRDPSAPYIDVVPNLGPAAIYDQTVSRKSENIINKIAGAYVDAYRRNSKDQSEKNEYEVETMGLKDKKKQKTIEIIKKDVRRALRANRRKHKLD